MTHLEAVVRKVARRPLSKTERKRFIDKPVASVLDGSKTYGEALIGSMTEFVAARLVEAVVKTTTSRQISKRAARRR